MVSLGASARSPDVFAVSTRRGKQFNSMIHRDVDPLTGAGRDAIFMSAADIARLQLREGKSVRLRSGCGTYEGTVREAAIKPGNLEVHWPEGMPLLEGSAIDPESMEPDYNATVSVEVIHDRP